MYKLFILFILLAGCSCRSDQSAGIKEGFITVKGGQVWYRITGADKKGIPLLVLHGGPGASHDYLESLATLNNERPVIFYDQLGCGKSEMPSDESLWTVERFADEVEQVRLALGLKKFHLMGQSWGSMLAVEYYLQKKPEKLVSLTLSGPYLSTPMWIRDQRRWISLLPANVQDTIRKYEENGDFASASYLEAMSVFYGKHVCRLNPWPASLDPVTTNFGTAVYQYMWGPSEFTVTGILKEADLTGELGKIKVPVLLTCGEFDEASPDTTAWYREQIPDARMYVIRDASHSHHLEKPAEYIAVLRKFLQETE